MCYNKHSYALRAVRGAKEGVLATMNQAFKNGLQAGWPIALGYFPVSIGFGMLAQSGGLSVLQAVLISVTNLTSAGQVAGTNLIIAGAPLLEIAAATLIINLRYMLMSLALSQKVDADMTLPQRLLVGFGITDEIYALASMRQGTLTFAFMMGLIAGPFCGWAAGTWVGAAASTLLPASVKSAFGVALYAMFVAIVVPSARRSRGILFTAALAVALSSALYYLPGLRNLSSGWAVILTAVAASAAAAWLMPLRPAETEESEESGVREEGQVPDQEPVRAGARPVPGKETKNMGGARAPQEKNETEEGQ